MLFNEQIIRRCQRSWIFFFIFDEIIKKENWVFS